MPRAKTGNTKIKKAGELPPNVKPAKAAPRLLGGKKPAAKKPAVKRAKRTAKAVAKPEHSQPDEVVVGRYYDVQTPNRRLFGELIGNGDEGQTLQVHRNGKPAEVLTVQFADQPVREISRELCYELSHTEMHSDKI
jgi:hypothetical protein